MNKEKSVSDIGRTLNKLKEREKESKRKLYTGDANDHAFKRFVLEYL